MKERRFFNTKDRVVALAKVMDEIWDRSAHTMEVIATISLCLSQRERFMENPIKCMREVSSEFHDQLRAGGDADIITEHWFKLDYDEDEDDSARYLFSSGVEALIDCQIVMGIDFKSQSVSIVANCYEHNGFLGEIKKTVMSSYIKILEENNRIQRLVKIDRSEAENLKVDGKIASMEIVDLKTEDDDEPF